MKATKIMNDTEEHIHTFRESRKNHKCKTCAGAQYLKLLNTSEFGENQAVTFCFNLEP